MYSWTIDGARGFITTLHSFKFGMFFDNDLFFILSVALACFFLVTMIYDEKRLRFFVFYDFEVLTF